MYLLIKFQEPVKVQIKGERTETETVGKYGGEICIKTGMKKSSKKNFVYLNVILIIQWVSLDRLLKKTPTSLVPDTTQSEKWLALTVYRLALIFCSY